MVTHCSIEAKDLPQWVSVAKCCGITEAGELDYGRPEEIRALIQPMFSTRESNSGTELLTRHMLITIDDIGIRDLVWLPGCDDTDRDEARVPVSVAECFDPQTRCIQHYEVVI